MFHTGLATPVRPGDIRTDCPRTAVVHMARATRPTALATLNHRATARLMGLQMEVMPTGTMCQVTD